VLKVGPTYYIILAVYGSAYYRLKVFVRSYLHI